ncbi:MAG: CDGSH iron-sulfur domain-containing protein [Hyphomonadaceae bacterium]|nr:CDGSH iron-sulfur domain-containing protein [Hyphomonadaceae bacterium]
MYSSSGEPPTGDRTDMLAVRNGPVEIAPQLDGPLAVYGNLEIISGTGRVVSRAEAVRLCRCGHSNTKPFCDGSHSRVSFRSV